MRLEISCLVNGDLLQHDRTSSMFYGVRQIISFCSQSFGELVNTCRTRPATEV